MQHVHHRERDAVSGVDAAALVERARALSPMIADHAARHAETRRVAPEVIAAISALNATLSLAPGRLSAAIARPLLAHDGKGSLRQLSQEVIRPFYQARADFAIDLLRQELAGYPLRIHQPEGAIFLWLWFEGLPISTNTLYEELKAAGTLVVPGAYYFPGIDTSQDRHAHECLRMSYAQDEATLRIGISSIARLVKQAYQKGKDHAP